MDRRKEVVLYDALRNKDRILEVVSAPGHEGNAHITAKGHLTAICRGAVGDNLPLLHRITWLDDRRLVDARILVRSLIFDQVDDVDVRFGGIGMCRFEYDPGGVYRLHLTVPFRDNRHT